jgi:hypothetical protein
MGRAYSMHGEKRNAYRISIGDSEGNRSLENTRRRQEDNMTLHLRQVGWSGTDWIRLFKCGDQRLAVVSTVMKLRFP